VTEGLIRADRDRRTAGSRRPTRRRRERRANTWAWPEVRCFRACAFSPRWRSKRRSRGRWR